MKNYLKASWTSTSASCTFWSSYSNLCPAIMNHSELITATSKAVFIITAPCSLICCRWSTRFRASRANCSFIIGWPMPNVRKCRIVNLRVCDHIGPSVNRTPWITNTVWITELRDTKTLFFVSNCYSKQWIILRNVQYINFKLLGINPDLLYVAAYPSFSRTIVFWKKIRLVGCWIHLGEESSSPDCTLKLPLLFDFQVLILISAHMCAPDLAQPNKCIRISSVAK